MVYRKRRFKRKRKRSYKRKVRRTGRSKPTKTMVSRWSPWPRSAITRMNYADVFNLNLVETAVNGNQTYRLNSIFDPSGVTGDSNCRGYNEWSRLYSRYYVYAAKVTARFFTTDAGSTNDYNGAVYMRLRSGNTINSIGSTTTLEDIRTLPNTTTKPFGKWSWGADTPVISKFVKIAAIEGKPTRHEDDYCGDMVFSGGTNPNIMPLVDVGFAPLGPISGTSRVIQLSVRITYYVYMFNSTVGLATTPMP